LISDSCLLSSSTRVDDVVDDDDDDDDTIARSIWTWAPPTPMIEIHYFEEIVVNIYGISLWHAITEAGI
jgi:hypothetical protein